jgi:hypothetical protein
VIQGPSRLRADRSGTTRSPRCGKQLR